jgi:hypothetical protein
VPIEPPAGQREGEVVPGCFRFVLPSTYSFRIKQSYILE